MENGEEKGGDVKVSFFPGPDFLKLRLVVGSILSDNFGFRDGAEGRDGIAGLGAGLRVGRGFCFLDADRLGNGGDLLPAARTERSVFRQLCATVLTEHDKFLLSLLVL